MKIAISSSYIPKHAGGGERYILSIAEVASQLGDVTLLVPADQVEAAGRALHGYERQFGLDLSRLHVEASPIGVSRSPFDVLKATRAYDVLFATTDGSIFASGAKKSYFIAQVPWTFSLGLAARVKLSTWRSILVYSPFVQKILRQSWKTDKVCVLSPYVDLHDFVPAEKEHLIANVGRFFAHTGSNSKRQDVLIDAFCRFIDTYHHKGWQLVLTGNVDPNPDSWEYVESLKIQAKGYPISILPNVSYEELRGILSRSMVYWHAAGYDVDENRHPENTEHFGITTLEAMASGCIPFVVPKGGQRDIVKEVSHQWENPEELATKTHVCITKAPEEREQLAITMRNVASSYSKELFRKDVLKLVGGA